MTRAHDHRRAAPALQRRPAACAASAVLIAAALLAACAGGPKPPDWQVEAKAAMDRANAAWLEGNNRVAQAELLRARSQLSRTGRADLIAQAELLHCATRVASVVFEPCSAFEALRADATPAQRAYADYLRGHASPEAMALLPPAQRDAAAGAGLAATADPLSQLVAAGVLLQSGQSSPAVIDQAIATASAQGWRRPLMAWLGVQAQRADLAGDREAAARLRRRMDLAQDPATTPRASTAPTAPVAPVLPAPPLVPGKVAP